MTDKNESKYLLERKNIDEDASNIVNTKVPQELYLHVNRCPSVIIRNILDSASANSDVPCFSEVFKDINDFNRQNRPVFCNTEKIVLKDETEESFDTKKPPKKPSLRKNRKQKVIEEDKSDENFRVPQLCKHDFTYVHVKGIEDFA